jgi:hypothetical protein
MADLKEIFAAFENLGDNCEFGIAQRRVGIEPLGLLRFAGTKHLPSITAAISTGFTNFGEMSDVEIFGEENQFYGVHIKSHHIIYATPHRWGTKNPEAILTQELARIKFLKRRLLEDLSEARKIFVRKGEFDSLEQILDLSKALRQHGPNNLLWVTEEDGSRSNGTVEILSEGVFIGAISKYAPYSDVLALDVPNWVTVCERCVELVSSASKKEFVASRPGVSIKPSAVARHFWDPYANWQYASAVSTEDGIPLSDRSQSPNIASPYLVSILSSICLSQTSVETPFVTVADFSCDGGRNLPLLRSIFHRVVGFDRPEAARRLRDEKSIDPDVRYDAIYDQLNVLLNKERVSFIYDSVKFQEIVDSTKVNELANVLASSSTLMAIVSMSNLRAPIPVLDKMVKSYKWKLIFSETDWGSFSGYPHEIQVFRRPMQWTLEMQDQVAGMRPEGGDWRPITIRGNAACISEGWHVTNLYSEFAPIFLIRLERRDAHIMWFVDEDGAYLGDSINALPIATRTALQQSLRQMLTLCLQSKFAGMADKFIAVLLDLVASTDGFEWPLQPDQSRRPPHQ